METQASAESWDQFHQEIQTRVDPLAWQTWIEPLKPRLEGGVLHLEAPSDFHLRWVRDRYLAAITEVSADLFDSPDVALETPVDKPETNGRGTGSPPRGVTSPTDETTKGDAVDTAPSLLVDPAAASQQPLRGDHRLVPKYVFDNFVVGQSNRFAHAAAMAVSEQPGSHYNPLFIYGHAGLGKTHLLHAVGHHTLELEPRSVVRYVSSEQFFNEFINGIRRKRMDEFKARYRTIDTLLLDDVQFFEGKEQILEEFFHTFNSLYEAGKQLVISSDRPPKHLSSLEDRLRSRFEWGLLTDIQPPDVETRLAILRKNAEFAPTPVGKDVLDFIAAHVLDNIRELEGALTRVTAFAALTQEPITLEMAHEVLQDIVPEHETGPLNPEDIINVTSAYYSVNISDLLGPSRKQPLALYRQVAMYLCRELTNLSLPKIGALFGGRDHTTVIHAIDKVKRLMQSDREVFHQVNKLSQKLRKTS